MLIGPHGLAHKRWRPHRILLLAPFIQSMCKATKPRQALTWNDVAGSRVATVLKRAASKARRHRNVLRAAAAAAAAVSSAAVAVYVVAAAAAVNVPRHGCPGRRCCQPHSVKEHGPQLPRRHVYVRAEAAEQGV